MPTFPSLPEIISAEPWHLTDGAGLSLYFDVPGPIQWTRPEEARLAQDPCGGPPTLLTTQAHAPPRRFRVTVRINAGATRNARMAALEAAWAAHGPYTLTAGAITATPFTVLLDASQGGLQWEADHGARTATVGFQECDGTVIGPPPLLTPALLPPGGLVPGTAFLVWDLLAAVPDVSYTVRVIWDYSGTDMTPQDALYFYQAGATTEDLRAHAFSLGGDWWPLAGTGGAATGTVTVTFPAARFDAFPAWQLAYYHYTRGLLPTALTILREAPPAPGVEILWTWLAVIAGPTGTYPASVAWNYHGTDPTAADQLYLFQVGTTSADIAAAATDPVSGRWFPVALTYGVLLGSTTAEVDAVAYSAYPTWHAGYYHPVHGLLDAGAVVPAGPIAPAPPVALGFTWEPRVPANGAFGNYTLAWDYGWADQHPDDYIVLHDATLDAATAAAATNDYPDYHYFLVWTVGRAGRSGSVVLGLADVTFNAHTPRFLSYYSVTHAALLGTIALPAFPL